MFFKHVQRTIKVIMQPTEQRIRKEFLPVFLLALVTFAVYAQAVNFEFLWDDLVFVKGVENFKNLNLRGIFLSPGNGVEYLPIRDLTYAIDYAIWGESARGFHLTNIAFFVLTVVVVYFTTIRVLGALTPARDKTNHRLIALITSGIFALHPLHVEPVAAVFARNVLVSGLFAFLSLNAYLKHIEQPQAQKLVASFAFYLLALFSKATAITIPALFLVIAILSGKQLKQRFLELVPFFLLSLLAFFLFKEIASSAEIIAASESFTIEASGFGSKLAVALQIPFFYLIKFVVPVQLSADYSIEFSRQLVDPIVIISAALLVVVTFAGLRNRRVNQVAVFALAAYLLLLFPVLNFFLTNPVVADRYAYLPIYSLSLLMSLFLPVAFRQIKLTVIAAVLLVTVLGILSFERLKTWSSGEVLWQNTLITSPNSITALLNLPEIYFEKGQYGLAQEMAGRLSEISPSSAGPDLIAAKLELTKNNYRNAIEIMEAATFEKEPNARLLVTLAATYETIGEFDKAYINYQKVISLPGTHPFEAPLAREKSKHLKPSLLARLKPLRQKADEQPADPQAAFDLALGLDSAGLDEEALVIYQHIETKHGANWALSLNTGNILFEQNKFALAVSYFRKSIDMNPNNPQALNGLGLALKAQQDFAGAEDAFLRAINIAPGFEKPPYNLAVMYFRMGEKEKARHYFKYTADRFPSLSKRAESYLKKI